MCIRDRANPDDQNLINNQIGARIGDPSFVKNLLLQNQERRFLKEIDALRKSNQNIGVVGADGTTQSVPLHQLFNLKQNISQIGSASQAPSAINQNISATNENDAQTALYEQEKQTTENLRKAIGDRVMTFGEGENAISIPGSAINNVGDLGGLFKDSATIGKIEQQTAQSLASTDNTLNKTSQAKQLFPSELQASKFKAKKAKYDWQSAKYKMQESKIDAWLAKETKDLKLTQEQAKAKKLKYEAIIKKFESEGKMTNFQFLGDGQAIAFKQNPTTGKSEVVSINMKGTPKIVRDWKKVQRLDENQQQIEVLVSPSLKQEIVLGQDANGEETFGMKALNEKGELKVGDKFNTSLKMDDKTKNDLRTTVNIAKSMIDVLNRHPEVAGGKGMWERFKELPKSAKGITDIPATNFQTALRFLNFNATPLLLAEKRFTDMDRKIVREAIGGQGLLDLAGKTKGGMQFLVSLLEARLNDTPIQKEDILAITMGEKNPGIIKQAQLNLQRRLYPNVGQLATNPQAGKIFQSNPIVQGAMNKFGDKLRFNPTNGAFFYVQNGKPQYVLKNGKLVTITDKDQLKTLKEINNDG